MLFFNFIPVFLDEKNIFESPSSLLSALKNEPELTSKILNDEKFGDAWNKISSPFHCPICETNDFADKDILLEHIRNHNLTLKNDNSSNEGEMEIEINNADQKQIATANDNSEPVVKSELTGNADNAINKDTNEEINDTDTKKASPSPAIEDKESSIYKVNFSAICPVGSKPRKPLYPGISLLAHKQVLVNVGLDHVTHFVENRSRVNRQKAKEWKESPNEEDQTDLENSSAIQNTKEVNNVSNACSNTANEMHMNVENQENEKVQQNGAENDAGAKHVLPITSEVPKIFPCMKCGKEFSTVWVLKVHQKVNHDNDLTCDEVAEFAKGYSEWFWKCAKEEENQREKDNLSNLSKPVPRKTINEIEESTNSRNRGNPENENCKQNEARDEKSFQQMALETLMRNYGVAGESKSMKNKNTLPSGLNNMQQQQMMMQLLLSQQMNGGENMPNNFNNILQMMYGASMQMQSPTNLAELISGMGAGNINPQMMGMSPYHWLALAAQQQQQQQQMQQLLMYPQLTAQAVPFLQGGNMPEEARQQLMAMLAAGQNQSTGAAGMNPASMAAALQMFQGGTSANNTPSNVIESSETEKTANKVSTFNQRAAFPPPLIHAQQLSPALPKGSDIPMKRPRTRITDDQLKVLRSHFDINTSPGDDQIAEMAMRTGLPSKVIKHWFRNTLFKERQRSKDSPYNFNIPPMTLLDDAKEESQSEFNIPDLNPMNELKPQSEAQRFSPNVSQQQLQPEVNNSNCDSDYEVADSSSKDAIPTSQIPFSSEIPVPQTLFTNALALMPTMTKLNESHSPSQKKQENEAENMEDNSYKFDSSALTSYSAMNPMLQHSFNFADSNMQDYSSMGSNKRTPRTRFSDFQLKVLQDFFDRNAYPKDDDLDKLSQLLDLSTRVIVVWFQNARQKARKNYEMQQHQGVQKRNSGSKSFTNSMLSQYASSKQMDYPSSNPSPNSKSPIDFANLSRSRSITPESRPQTQNIPSNEKQTPNENTDTQSKHDINPRESIEREMIQCKLCGTELPNLQLYQQHLQMHAKVNPFMSSLLQQYGMIPPSREILQNMMSPREQADSSKHSIEEKMTSHFHARTPSTEDQIAYMRASFKPDPDALRPSSNTVRSMLVTPPMANADLNRGKRKLSVSPSHSASSSSSALSPVSARSQNSGRGNNFLIISV